MDFVPEQGNFEKYKLLVAPLQYLMSPDLEQKYMDYVKNGGHLILTMRTGVKDKNNLCMTDQELPGKLRELAGIEVLDYDCLRDAHVQVLFQGQQFQADIWSDLMRLLPDTKVLANYASEFYAGEPCITQHPYGQGICYYIGTQPGEDFMKELLAIICQTAEVTPLSSAIEDVEFMVRENENSQFLFVINHSNEAKSYSIPEQYELLRGVQAGILAAYEVQILERTKNK